MRHIEANFMQKCLYFYFLKIKDFKKNEIQSFVQKKKNFLTLKPLNWVLHSIKSWEKLQFVLFFVVQIPWNDVFSPWMMVQVPMNINLQIIDQTWVQFPIHDSLFVWLFSWAKFIISISGFETNVKLLCIVFLHHWTVE